MLFIKRSWSDAWCYQYISTIHLCELRGLTVNQDCPHKWEVMTIFYFFLASHCLKSCIVSPLLPFLCSSWPPTTTYTFSPSPTPITPFPLTPLFITSHVSHKSLFDSKAPWCLTQYSKASHAKIFPYFCCSMTFILIYWIN